MFPTKKKPKTNFQKISMRELEATLSTLIEEAGTSRNFGLVAKSNK
jgi:hypothetical protein